MIGQKTLVEQFNKFTLNTLPHSMFFIGDIGCGKHLFIQEICSKFNLVYQPITDKINYDLIEQINSTVDPTLIVIEADTLTWREEPVLLKFIEEPHRQIYITLVGTSTAFISSTIINRCQVFRFQNYTIDELSEFYTGDSLNKEQALQIANTPGKLKQWSSIDFKQLIDYANLVLNKVSAASLANLFLISDKIDFDGKHPELYNTIAFMDTLLYCAKQKVISNLPNALAQYNLTSKLYNELFIPNINKKYLFEHYLFELKGIKNERI